MNPVQNSVKNLLGFLGDLKTPKFHSEINWPLAMIVGFWHIYAVQCCLDSYTFTCTHWPHNHNFNLIYCLIHFSRISLNGNFWCFIWQYVLKNWLFFLFLVNIGLHIYFSTNNVEMAIWTDQQYVTWDFLTQH